ncbi:hypothetical protein [Streptomyces sp. NPDC002788]
MAAFAKPRGDIIVGGTPITASREIPGSDLAYQRVNRDLPMYDPVTGYLQAQGATFLEGVHGDLLIGEAVRLTSNPLDELTGRKPRGGDWSPPSTRSPARRSRRPTGRLHRQVRHPGRTGPLTRTPHHCARTASRYSPAPGRERTSSDAQIYGRAATGADLGRTRARRRISRAAGAHSRGGRGRRGS